MGSAVWGRAGLGAGCAGTGVVLAGAGVGVGAAGGSYRFWNSSRPVFSLLPPVAQISAPAAVRPVGHPHRHRVHRGVVGHVRRAARALAHRVAVGAGGGVGQPRKAGRAAAFLTCTVSAAGAGAPSRA